MILTQALFKKPWEIDTLPGRFHPCAIVPSCCLFIDQPIGIDGDQWKRESFSLFGNIYCSPNESCCFRVYNHLWEVLL